MKHNPDNLTPAQVGNGWRLLDEDETAGVPPRSVPEIQKWDDGKWVSSGDGRGYYGNQPDITYRTSLTRQQLHEKRNQISGR